MEIPEENYAVLEWEKEGLPLVAMLNIALRDFEPKAAFGWHLSVIIDFEDLVEKGMPSKRERAVLEPFCDMLDDEIKVGGNALFLVRETWNKTRRMVWRVRDPEIAHHHLQRIIEYKLHPRNFDYHMEQDVAWEQARRYLEQVPPGTGG